MATASLKSRSAPIVDALHFLGERLKNKYGNLICPCDYPCVPLLPSFQECFQPYAAGLEPKAAAHGVMRSTR